MSRPGDSRTPYRWLLLLTAIAVAIHGYHLGTDDAEIYVAAVKKSVDSSLFPFGSQFFMSHGRLSLFSTLVADSSRLMHVPIDGAIFLWHVFSIFLLLIAGWEILCCCFESDRARWAGVVLLAGVLAVPVAGTALVIMDPYLTARSLSTPSTLLAISGFVAQRYRRAFAWLVFTAFIHPQMSVYCAVFFACLALARVRVRQPEPVPVFGMMPAILPRGFIPGPAQGNYREALMMRTYFFIYNWAWYEWLGAVVPLVMLGVAASLPWRGTLPPFRRICIALTAFGTLAIVAALVISIPESMQNFARLQPMRSLHLVYVIFFLFLGALGGEYLLKNRAWPALVLFVPLAAGMWWVAEATYPSSPHIEWPGMRLKNPWLSAFVWIRDNTPKDAVFALDPKYMDQPGVDHHGFRAIAERSVLADYVKDSGAVSLFPQLADEWKREVTAQEGWEHFTAGDFQQLASQYPVTWILVKKPAPAGFDCPYQNEAVTVCRIPVLLSEKRPSDF
jgi:hypothetical protein